ncbi:hypothetical protein CLV62_101440 [Dysgonomonas alginatilytica]|uniref:Uncharacterized protein n=1 Tax=Dysgonomonas alginatilytica TaxID=1605892 RepID=A0A2V3PWE5_9BACT|nr:hypothetical protein [Dysgonomonas alginatilytica]PXV69171.1 hypothetical protein CLV62_101440 [Dysgonomonas alginatilytica]
MRILKHCVSILCLLLSMAAIAQVGINTSSPQGVFDLRVAEGANKKGFTVTDDGKLIIGTSTSTTSDARLIVEGGMRIKTGSEGLNKYYISDANGVGEWKSLTLGSNVSTWKLSNPAFNFTSVKNLRLTGVSELLSNNIAGFMVSASVPNSLYVAAGKYLVFFNGDISGVEFCELALISVSTSADLYRISYTGWLGGTAVFLEAATSQWVGLAFTHADKSGSSLIMPIPSQTTYFYTLTFLRLEN